MNRDPAAGARIAKLRAEMHLCRVLLVGVPVIALVGYLRQTLNQTDVFALLAVFIGAICALLYLRNRSRFGLENNWILLGGQQDWHNKRQQSDGAEPRR